MELCAIESNRFLSRNKLRFVPITIYLDILFLMQILFTVKICLYYSILSRYPILLGRIAEITLLFLGRHASKNLNKVNGVMPWEQVLGQK